MPLLKLGKRKKFAIVAIQLPKYKRNSEKRKICNCDNSTVAIQLSKYEKNFTVPLIFRQWYCHNSFFFFSFSPFRHIMSLSSLLHFFRILIMVLPKFSSLLIFLNKLYFIQYLVERLIERIETTPIGLQNTSNPSHLISTPIYFGN